MNFSKLAASKCVFTAAMFLISQFAAAKDLSDWPSIYKRTHDGVAILFHNRGLCSGSLIEPNRILTAAHCVDALKEVIVMWNNSKTQESGRVVALDVKHDLALIVLEKPTTRPVIPILENEESLNAGDEVVAIGHPFGTDFFSENGLDTELNFILSRGIISKINSTSLITDVSLSPGNSGGPVLNRKGEIVGVVSKKMIGTGAGQVGYLATSRQVRELLSSAKDNDKLGFWNAKGQFIFGLGFFLDNDSKNGIVTRGWDVQFGYSFFKRFSLVFGTNFSKSSPNSSERYRHAYLEASYGDTLARLTPRVLIDASVFVQQRRVSRIESSPEQKTIFGGRLTVIPPLSLSFGLDVENLQSSFSSVNLTLGL
ncbi:MAG: heat-shock protein htrA serine protease [Pseudomonadota bacterium]